MAFLTLNGVTIPTAKGGGQDITEIGDRQRAFDGTYIRDTRAYKRKWKFATKPVSELRAQAIAGLIQGRGLYMPFEADENATNGFVSTGNATAFSSVAADGAAVLDSNGVSFAKFGTGCIAGEIAVTTPNGLALAMAQCSATTGMVGLNGATLSVDSANFWQGTTSIKVAGNGVTASPYSQISLGNGVLGKTYVITVYIKGAPGVTSNAAVTFADTANSVVTNTPTFSLSGAWRRITATVVTPGSGFTPSMLLQIIGTAATDVFYYDGLMMEITTLGSIAGSFVLPGSNRVAGDTLHYVACNPMGPAGMTINFWLTKPYTVSANCVLFALDYGTALDRIYVPTSTPTTINWAGAVVATGLTYTGWHMVTCVYRINAETGEFARTMYFDGVLQGTGAAAVPSGATGFYVGNDAGSSSPSYCHLDDMQVLPFPVDVNWVTGMFGIGGSPAPTPFLTARGDLMPDSNINVMGQVERISYMGYSDAGTWRPNGSVVDFTLEEI